MIINMVDKASYRGMRLVTLEDIKHGLYRDLIEANRDDDISKAKKIRESIRNVNYEINVRSGG